MVTPERVPGSADVWVADVACFWCGTVLSACRLSRPSGGRLCLAPAVLRALAWRGGRPRCPTCGGPIYLDDVRRLPAWERILLTAGSPAPPNVSPPARHH